MIKVRIKFKNGESKVLPFVVQVGYVSAFGIDKDRFIVFEVLNDELQGFRESNIEYFDLLEYTLDSPKVYERIRCN